MAVQLQLEEFFWSTNIYKTQDKASQHISKSLKWEHVQAARHKQYMFTLLLVIYKMTESWNN